MMDWAEAAENKPDVFAKPVITPQGQDGVAHFNYFDPERMLSFQWDGEEHQHVVVSYGGYGEPIKWTFDFMDMWQYLDYKSVGGIQEVRGDRPLFTGSQPIFWQAVAHFHRACRNWVRFMEYQKFTDTTNIR
jgi:hypothetical protein